VKKAKMAITFNKTENKNRVREPLFQLNRIKFKSPRNSLSENLESNLLKIDFSRILDELTTMDLTVLNKITYFIGDINDYNEASKLEDGISYTIDGINIYIDDIDSTENTLEVDTMNKLSGKLARLFYKVSLLENGN
jgi:hypothetical protein